MSSYLILKQAVKHSGKSESTLKRLIREITADPDHTDRHHILPDAAELQQKRDAGEPYIWKISDALLDERYGTPPASDEKRESNSMPSGDDGTVIAILREQLQSKDRQIETLEQQLDRKDEQIANQNERMREANVLMKDLQQRLAITAPGSSSEVVIEPTAEQGSKVTPVPPAAARKSIWTRNINLFGWRR